MKTIKREAIPELAPSIESQGGFSGYHFARLGTPNLHSAWNAIINRYGQDKKDFEAAASFISQVGSSFDRARLEHILSTWPVEPWQAFPEKEEYTIKDLLDYSPVLFFPLF